MPKVDTCRSCLGTLVWHLILCNLFHMYAENMPGEVGLVGFEEVGWVRVDVKVTLYRVCGLG